ncbi:Superoxide dismutase [Cu-Zn] 3 [Platanthera guangdongensis]|uniref:Superoxide dismutase [Cu-Zn] 3 n=1 Tax=Platanthera guangdongensis TaxID=2320717 RepID=A0ABR2LNH8_9ASPA
MSASSCLKGVSLIADGGSDNSTVRGSLQFSQDPHTGFTHVTGKITGLSPGLHGFHIHSFGDTTNVYVLKNQLRMNDNLTKSHNVIVTELKNTTTALTEARAKDKSEFDKKLQEDLATFQSALQASQKIISAQLLKFKAYYTERTNYLDTQIRFQKNDLRDHIERKVIKGERLIVNASSDHGKWITNAVRATLGYPPLCDDDNTAESGIQAAGIEGGQQEVAQIIYPPSNFEEIQHLVDQMYSPPEGTKNVIIEKVESVTALNKEQEAQLSKKRFREQTELKPDFEQWSPTYRNIILTAWKAVKDKTHDRGKW